MKTSLGGVEYEDLAPSVTHPLLFEFKILFLSNGILGVIENYLGKQFCALDLVKCQTPGAHVNISHEAKFIEWILYNKDVICGELYHALCTLSFESCQSLFMNYFTYLGAQLSYYTAL